MTQLMGLTLMETFLLTSGNHASAFVQPCKTKGVTDTFKVSVQCHCVIWLFVDCVVRSAVC